MGNSILSLPHCYNQSEDSHQVREGDEFSIRANRVMPSPLSVGIREWDGIHPHKLNLQKFLWIFLPIKSIEKFSLTSPAESQNIVFSEFPTDSITLLQLSYHYTILILKTANNSCKMNMNVNCSTPCIAKQTSGAWNGEGIIPIGNSEMLDS